MWHAYYRKRGSASYIVREWLLWEGERERERDACDVNWYHAEIASDHALWLPRRRVDPTRRRVLSLSSVHVLDKELGVRALEQQAMVEWWWMTKGSVSFAFAGQPAVNHPVPIFVGMQLQARRIVQVNVYFLFEWKSSGSAFENSLDSGYPFRKRPLRAVHRKRCGKRGSGDWKETVGLTTRLSDRSMPFPLCASPLKGEVQRSPDPSARPSAAADSEERQYLYDMLFGGECWIVLMLSPIVRDVQR